MKTPCIEWLGYRTKAGYGECERDGKKQRAHRLMMADWLGIPIEALDGICVLHTCDNPPCCNPDHLFLGDHQDNVRDREEKGRGVAPVGSQHGQSKLTEAQVIDLRAQYASGEWTQAKLAARYSIKQSLVSMIVNRKVWSHV